MKRNLIILIALTISICAHAQNTDSTISIKESETPFIGSDIPYHSIKRVIQFKEGKSTPIYAQNKKIQSRTFQQELYEYEWQYWSPDDIKTKADSAFLEFNQGSINGLYTFVYKDGKNRAEGLFKDGKKFGKWTSWYSNGKIESEGDYYKDFKIGKWHNYYSDGTTYSVENYISDTPFINAVLLDGISKHVRRRKEDIMPLDNNFHKKHLYTGISKWYYFNGQLSSEENWDIVLLTISQWNKNGQGKKTRDIDRYTYLENTLKFNGDLYGYFNRKIHFSKSEKKEIGKVVVSFVLTATGKINDISVLSPTNEIEKAKIKQAIEETQGKWTVAKTHNIPRTTKITLTINLT